jgi:hypothetical protein
MVGPMGATTIALALPAPVAGRRINADARRGAVRR